MASPFSLHHVHCADKTIETTVTYRCSAVKQWLQSILATSQSSPSPVVVGLEIEWKPRVTTFTYCSTATLQLCVGLHCLIIQLEHLGSFPKQLRDFLKSDEFLFVGVGIEDDVGRLRHDHGLHCHNYTDLLVLARERYPGRFLDSGLKELALEVAGISMVRNHEMCVSYWESCALSAEQVEYACIDAYASYCIGHKLLVDN